MLKKIGVMTSGGDCPGLNATIRAVTLHAINQYGAEVVGIRNGIMGFLNKNYTPLSAEICNANMLRTAGTILGSTTKESPFRMASKDGAYLDRSDEVIKEFKDLKLDAIIAIGGDGSMKINQQFVEKGGINIVAIPKTIDNDLALNDYSIGFSSAVEVATEAIDRLQPTAASHDRVLVLEVMGRDAGHIAMYSGIAGGADIILVPEFPYSMESICSHINKIKKGGKNYAIIVVSEAVKSPLGSEVVRSQKIDNRKRYGGISFHLATALEALIDVDTRSTVLGHVQRGAQPTPEDRILAANLGAEAVNCANDRDFGKIIVWQNCKLKRLPIIDTINNYNKLSKDDTIVKTAKALGIYIGDI